MKQIFFKFLLFATLAGFLSACGGGGNDTGSTDDFQTPAPTLPSDPTDGTTDDGTTDDGTTDDGTTDDGTTDDGTTDDGTTDDGTTDDGTTDDGTTDDGTTDDGTTDDGTTDDGTTDDGTTDDGTTDPSITGEFVSIDGLDVTSPFSSDLAARAFETDNFYIVTSSTATSSDAALQKVGEYSEKILPEILADFDITTADLGLNQRKLTIFSNKERTTGGGSGHKDGIETIAYDNPNLDSYYTENDDRFFKGLLKHELVHVVHHNLGPSDFSLEFWFADGLASYYGKNTPGAADSITVSTFLNDPNNFNPVQFDSYVAGKDYYYSYFALAVRFLLAPTSEGGAGNTVENIKELLADMRDSSADFDTAFAANITHQGSALTMAEFEANFKNWVIAYLEGLEFEGQLTNAEGLALDRIILLPKDATVADPYFAAEGSMESDSRYTIDLTSVADGEYDFYLASETTDAAYGPGTATIANGEITSPIIDVSALPKFSRDNGDTDDGTTDPTIDGEFVSITGLGVTSPFESNLADRAYQTRNIFIVTSADVPSTDAALQKVGDYSELMLSELMSEYAIKAADLALDQRLLTVYCDTTRTVGGGTGHIDGIGMIAYDNPNLDTYYTDGDDKLFKATIKHELAHTIELNLGRDDFSKDRWFSEGTASYFGGNTPGASDSITVNRFLDDPNNVNPISIARFNDVEDDGDYYPYYALAIRFLLAPVSEGGAGNTVENIKGLLGDMKTDGSLFFDQAFENNFSYQGTPLSVTTLENNYQDWVTSFLAENEFEGSITNAFGKNLDSLSIFQSGVAPSDASRVAEGGVVNDSKYIINLSTVADGTYDAYFVSEAALMAYGPKQVTITNGTVSPDPVSDIDSLPILPLD